MLLVGLLTGFALAGVWAGVYAGGRSRLSVYSSAAGGGLLLGLALFWLLPEVQLSLGVGKSLMLVFGFAALFFWADQAISHRNAVTHAKLLWPLLAATGVHSFLDGWAVRLLAAHPMTDLTISAGLALHKIPEGAAIGWLAAHSLKSRRAAFAAAALFESFTLVGGVLEPLLTAGGFKYFGPQWEVWILALITSGFLFLGLHTAIPHWRRLHAMATFVVAVALAAVLRLLP